MELLWLDASMALRLLLKKWHISGVIILTLTLAMGANTAIFSEAGACLNI